MIGYLKSLDIPKYFVSSFIEIQPQNYIIFNRLLHNLDQNLNTPVEKSSHITV